MATVSIILINYNSNQFTFDCIASIRSQTKTVEYEIVVVDNGSSPVNTAALHTLADQPDIKLVFSRLNLGFSGGNMLGVQAASPTADYYYFLNNDCLLLTDVCGQLAAFMAQTSKAAVCSAQMFSEGKVWRASFGYFPTVGVKLVGHSLLRLLKPTDYPPIRPGYTEPVRVPFVMGSSLFIRASAFGAVGGFDTVYFLYREEEDICKQLALKGFETWLVPQAEYIHFTGQSTNRNYAIEREHYISLFHYYRKFHCWPERVLFRLFFSLKAFRKFPRDWMYARLAWFILRGSPIRESLRYRQVIIE